MPNAPIDLNALPIRRDEVAAALANEKRRRVRKRLLVIDAILDGKSIEEAAQAANATRAMVERCLKRVHQSGLQSLFCDRRCRPFKWRMTAHRVEATRRAIAAALARPLGANVRLRLLAVEMVLSGRPIDEVARTVHVLPGAVRTWLRDVSRDGFAPTLARWEGQGKPRPRQLNADPVALRELAAKEMNPRVRRRMLALACVAEGMSPLDAAVSAGLNHGTVLKSMKRFREEGISAFGDKKHSARARKLSLLQIQQIQAELLRNPNMGDRELPAFLLERFGVRYTFAGLRALLNREFGIVWRDGRFTQAPKTMTLDEDLRQQLGIAELQAALARTRDLRLKRKLIALIQLAQGWEADRVAFQVGAAPETLANWVALYQRLGVHAFHRTS